MQGKGKLRSGSHYHVCGAEITTGLDTTEEEGRDRPMQKAKMEIILTKSPQFDELMAASASQQHGGSSGPQAPGGHPPGMGPSSQPQVTPRNLAHRAKTQPTMGCPLALCTMPACAT